MNSSREKLINQSNLNIIRNLFSHLIYKTLPIVKKAMFASVPFLPFELLMWLSSESNPAFDHPIIQHTLHVNYLVPYNYFDSEWMLNHVIKLVYNWTWTYTNWGAHYLACSSKVIPPLILNEKSFVTIWTSRIDKRNSHKFLDKTQVPKLVGSHTKFLFWLTFQLFHFKISFIWVFILNVVP